MMMFPADVAISQSRARRRASTSARKRSLTEGKLLQPGGSLPSLTRSLSGRRSSLNPEDRGEGGAALVPEAILFLERVSTAFAVTKVQSDVRYVMTVHHGPLGVAWRHAKSFDEYRKLQQRLLKVLDHGHFCSADCPWLYTFLKSYFPKKHLFHFSNAKVIESRNETLARFFSTLQGVLLNRANHGCAVLTHAFALELVSFIYGDALQQYGLGDPFASGADGGDDATTTGGSRGSLSFSLRKSMSSQLDASFVEEESVSDDCGTCGICDSSLSGEAFASTNTTSISLTISSSSLSEDELGLGGSLPATLSAMGSVSSLGRASSSRSNVGRSARRQAYYITTLGCGHRFHDECIVPKLNENMSCPTCGHLEAS